MFLSMANVSRNSVAHLLKRHLIASRLFCSSGGASGGSFDEKHDPAITRLMENNQAYVKRKTEKDPDFFRRHAGGQKPDYFIIGCGDSRVPIEKVLGLGYGEVFVHRNVGNLVTSGDLNVLSALHFAVEVLQVNHIVVCGHYGCGAVQAACGAEDLGMVENWLRTIRDVQRIHEPALSQVSTEQRPGELYTDHHRRLVELSVREQCLNVFKNGVVQQARRQRSGLPRIHGIVYSLEEGSITPVPLKLRDFWQSYKHIYKLIRSDPGDPGYDA